MKLIKLTSPELIEAFFDGTDSITINEPVKVVSETEKVISEMGAVITLADGVLKIESLEAEVASGKKPEKKKK